MSDNYHVVLEIDSGKAPYMAKLPELEKRGWKKGTRYLAHPDVIDEEGNDAGTYDYWEAAGNDVWVSRRAFPKSKKWSVHK